jgi:beta-hydroxylase
MNIEHDQSEQFPFLADLENNWAIVLSELNGLLQDQDTTAPNFIPWHETYLYEGTWDVYGLFAFGKKIEENCEKCPNTTKLVESIPGLVTAGFSALAPNTHIRPHVGYTLDVLRSHLGLIIPKPLSDHDRRSAPDLIAGTCSLRVASTIYTWEPGKAFVFDDTIEHEAFNWGHSTRYILMVDFKKPDEVGGVAP